MSEIWYMCGGEILVNVHEPLVCFGANCAFHHPSDHPLNKCDLVWSFGLLRRICEHGVAHPDPDDLAWRLRVAQPVYDHHHPCCLGQCCRPDIDTDQ